MLCKIHELKKAFNRFNNLQKFKGFLLCDEENLCFCSINETMSYAFKVEVEDGEKQAYMLTYENINSLIEYFKNIRVRRNCRISFQESSLIIEIEEKNGEFNKSLSLLVNKVLPEEKRIIEDWFLINDKGYNLNVNDFVLFTKLCVLRKKDPYFPASQYVNFESENNGYIICYGYDESIIRYTIPCETKSVSRETFSYDYIKLLNDLFKETLSSRAKILFEEDKLYVNADTFIAVGKNINENFIDLNLLMNKTKCDDQEMFGFPKNLLNKLHELNKEKSLSYPQKTIKLNGKTMKISKCTVNHELDKFLIYFEQNNNTYEYSILSTTFENLPDGCYYKANKLYKYFKGNDDAKIGFGKAGTIFYSKGNVDLLLLGQYQK